jgi:hypothetical protein
MTARYPVAWGHVALIGVLAAGIVLYLWDTVAASQSVANLILVPAVSVLTLTLLAVVLARALAGRDAPIERPAKADDDAPAWHTAAYLILLTLFVLLAEVAGFDLATFLFVAAALALKGERHPAVLVAYPLAFAVFCTWAFKAMIPYPMPALLPYP